MKSAEKHILKLSFWVQHPLHTITTEWPNNLKYLADRLDNDYQFRAEKD